MRWLLPCAPGPLGKGRRFSRPWFRWGPSCAPPVPHGRGSHGSCSDPAPRMAACPGRLRLLWVAQPGSGIAALRMTDGRILLAFNDTHSGRDNLRLAISSDEGATWRRGATVASEPGAEFSYPYLIQTRDGGFTWPLPGSASPSVVEFNTAWLDATTKEGSP